MSPTISNATAVPSNPSGNTISIGCMACPNSLALLSMVRTSAGSAPAAQVLLQLLGGREVPFHRRCGLLQIVPQLRLIRRRQQLVADLVNVLLVGLDLRLDERLVELLAALPRQL